MKRFSVRRIKFEISHAVLMASLRAKMSVSRRVDRMVRHTAIFRQAESDRNVAQLRAARIDAENSELRERVADISRRLCNVSVMLRPTGVPILRICLDLDPIMIQRGFLHGGDTVMIEYIGRDIGHRAANEIKRANFARWPDEDYLSHYNGELRQPQ